MNINHIKLRQLFEGFWKSKNHQEVPAIPLVPKDDPTTLFTGSGMQQLVPYLLGEPHPLGKRLYNIQRCLRAQDIEEVGDNRHDTFFEMMGNWSLGDYFKKEQLSWFWEFLTKVLKLPKEKLYVTIFKGNREIPADQESYQIWKSLGIAEDHIFQYEADKNWWSRSGEPQNMPSGEPGGPDSEVFYEFTQVPHDKKFAEACHPNCNCGRFLEIGNSVFMQYKKLTNNTFLELPKKNVDFGGGLERILAALSNDPDIFNTDVFEPIIRKIEELSQKKYQDNQKTMRIIADHLKSAVFLIKDGVEPSNKEQGYVLRRLIRRSAVQMRELEITSSKTIEPLCQTIVKIYSNYFNEKEVALFSTILSKEVASFEKTINHGIKLLQKQSIISGKLLFDLKQSYGFPLEISLELLEKEGKLTNKEKLIQEFQEAMTRHQNLSRTASAGKFKGGLADQSAQTLKYHTATHLLHQALFDVLGSEIRQEGSNITAERLRFDFYAVQKPTDQQIKKVAFIVNEKIKEGLPVSFKILPKKKAETLGAKSFFREKYPEMVKVYFIGTIDSPQKAYSKEFCGGPHVTNTKEIGQITLYKFEKIGSNLYRLYAK
jgi:alanyl-tRNA synthetase